MLPSLQKTFTRNSPQVSSDIPTTAYTLCLKWKALTTYDITHAEDACFHQQTVTLHTLDKLNKFIF
jgi:hypothetical protein